jgi:hypothetical protein
MVSEIDHHLSLKFNTLNFLNIYDWLQFHYLRGY